MTADRYDALLLIGFGGPEGPDDVMAFLRNVTRGRDVPDERLAQVAEHYHARGGVSPLNAQCRALLEALRAELARRGVELAWYWGNRNWHPLLADTVARMRDDGVRRALALTMSAFSSYSGCRQYLEDIDAAIAAAGEGAPVIHKIPPYFDTPGFLDAMTDRLAHALGDAPDGSRLLFCAHSIPVSVASTCDYEAQLRAAAGHVAAGADAGADHELVWQSRSGPPQVPWLEPDVNDRIAQLAGAVPGVVVAPIGFVSDHMEVIQDLDTEAATTARRSGLEFVRVATVGTHPRFVTSLCDLVVDNLGGPPAPLSPLALPGRARSCEPGCCPPPAPRVPDPGRTDR